MDKHLIEIAYEYAKDNFGRNSFTFKELFNALLKKDSSIKDKVSDLYIELLQDIRFISLGKQKWSLRENFKVSEISKITASMFGLDEYYENDIDEYLPTLSKSDEEENDMSDFVEEEDGENLDSTNISSEDEDVTEDEEIGKSSSSSSSDKDDDDIDDVDDDDEFIVGDVDDDDDADGSEYEDDESDQ